MFEGSPRARTGKITATDEIKTEQGLLTSYFNQPTSQHSHAVARLPVDFNLKLSDLKFFDKLVIIFYFSNSLVEKKRKDYANKVSPVCVN